MQCLSNMIVLLQLFRAMRQHQRFGGSSASSGAELADLASLHPNGRADLEDGQAPSSPGANGTLDQTRHRPAMKGTQQRIVQTRHRLHLLCMSRTKVPMCIAHPL
jgi:hypothetical protein